MTNPCLNSATLLLAEGSEQKQNYEKPQSLYSQILARDPCLAPAANNSTCLLMEHGGDIDAALSYAQIARAEFSNGLHVADTIDWIYYNKNVFKRATSLLNEAAERLSSDPVVQYHLGMALIKSGDKAGARRRLKISLSFNQNFQEAERARTALAAI